MSSVPTGYGIGLARREELAALPAIEVEAAALFPVEDLAPELRHEGLSISFFRKQADAGRVWVVRSMQPPAPVGFAVATLIDGEAHLFEMDVLPAHGRRGLGTALVRSVAGWARGAGHARLTLTTFRHLAWNAPFYARLGFSELSASQIGPELAETLAREAEHGLDPARRVAMGLDLQPGGLA